MKKYLFILAGVAFFSLLTSENTFAQSSYSISRFSTTAQFYGGCNTASSQQGYLPLANRGNLITSGPTVSEIFPCGYLYLNGREYHSTPTIFAANHYNTSGYFSSDGQSGNLQANELGTSIQSDSYIRMQQRTALMYISSGIDTINMPASTSSSDNYNLYQVFVGYFYPSNSWTNPGTLQLVFNEGAYPFWTDTSSSTPMTSSEIDKLVSDTFDHSFSYNGSPKNYVPEQTYSILKEAYGVVDEDNWNSFAFTIATFPKYSRPYSLGMNGIHFTCGDRCRSAYPESLNFDAVLGVSDYTFRYIGLSPYYQKNGTLYTRDWDKFMTFRFEALDEEAALEMSNLASSLYTANFNSRQGWSGANSSSPGISWWTGIFNLSNIIFPFRNFFGFTSSQCASIPILGGMLGLGSGAEYCSWWPGSIRSILTPVFSVASMMLLFGFVLHWLKGRDQDIKELP